MRVPRIYTPQPLAEHSLVDLDDASAHHVGKVLRMEAGRALILFNGSGHQHFHGIIQHSDRKRVQVRLGQCHHSETESPLSIHLGQALSKGDKMEFTIQKAVELGVTEITPLWTEHCDVKLNSERLEKKHKQWLGIIISACEQSGRDIIPTLHATQKIEDWLAKVEGQEKWILDPRGEAHVSAETTIEKAVIAVGPEGGFSENEVTLSHQHGFKAQLIGPRILRTETAALTAITLLQSRWGDFN